MRNRIAIIVKTRVGDTRYFSVVYRGKCRMSVNVRKQLPGCDWEDIENAEIEAYKTCREYALEHGFTSVKIA